jgi:hypothetical protein
MSIFIFFFIEFKTNLQKFNDIESSKYSLKTLPEPFFTVPFEGKVIIEKRRYNRHITISGLPKSIEDLQKWAKEYLQDNSATTENLESFFRIDNGTYYFRTILFRDFNNEIVKQEGRMEISCGKCVLIIDIDYKYVR